VKISASACVLSNAISLASAIKRGGDTECLAHFAATEKVVVIRCTDKAFGTIATSLSMTVHEPGETAVSIGRLAALLSHFPANAKVEIETTATTLSVVSGKTRLRLPAVAVTELPSPITIDQEIGRVDISDADSLRLLEPLAVADPGRSRFYLAGVFWHSVDDQLVAIATDGIRLIRTSIAATNFSDDRRLIVPKEVAVALRRLLQKAHAPRVVVRRSRGLIAFDAPAFSFTARLIDAQFPCYESAIPPAAANSVLCKRLDLLAALARLSAAAPNLDSALVALCWGDGRCLDMHLAQRPLDGADVIAADVRGSAQAALALDQFTGLLDEFGGEHVQIETANEQPVVIRGAGGKLGLIVRSKWDFGSRIRDEHLASRSGAC
jgi:DNA polymerase III subunit beta